MSERRTPAAETSFSRPITDKQLERQAGFPQDPEEETGNYVIIDYAQSGKPQEELYDVPLDAENSILPQGDPVVKKREEPKAVLGSEIPLWMRQDAARLQYARTLRGEDKYNDD